MPCGYADSTVSTHTVTETGIRRIIGKRCRCAGWLACSEAGERNVICVEWQVEVSHTDTAGHYGISAWQGNTTREMRQKECQHTD